MGQLNVLYVFHLLTIGNQDEAVKAIVSGLRFSRDVANGGTLFATLIANSRAVDFAFESGETLVLTTNGS